MPVTLVDKQHFFTKNVALLILFAYEQGYELTFGEVWRTEEMAKIYAERNIGKINSVHRLRLAVDFNLWKDGKWLTATESFRPLGEYWESLSTADFKLVWGGRFDDGNHFSCENNGVR